MENRFYDNEFEKYLKEEADDYRMYPSDRVWRNIQQEIHGYRRWPALTIIAVFIISALVVGTVLVKPHKDTAIIAQTAKPVSKDLNHTNQSIKLTAKNQQRQYLSPVKNQQQPFEKISEPNIQQQEPESEMIVSDNLTMPLPNGIAVVLKAPVGAIITPGINNVVIRKSEENIMLQQSPSLLLHQESQNLNTAETTATISDVATREQEKAPYINLVPASFMNINAHEKIDFSKTKFDFNNLSLQGLSSSFKNDNINNAISFILNPTHKDGTETSSPLSRFKGKASKFDFQFYITPSVSYRRLVDNVNGELTKSYITALPFAANYVVDVNKVIQHMPAVGYEVGFTLGYNLNNRLAVRSGFQFNMRQYNINAFVHGFEPATIALLTGNTSNIVNTISGFRTVQGSAPIILKNRYYEVSMPVGLDWKVVNKKISWGIAASIQPTYTFDKEPFIITSNYKNYADGSQLLHNWNLNTNLETYIGYNTKNYKLQVGPQIRYQLMPTMSRAYPIREYLVDYGIKLSIIKALK